MINTRSFLCHFYSTQPGLLASHCLSWFLFCIVKNTTLKHKWNAALLWDDGRHVRITHFVFLVHVDNILYVVGSVSDSLCCFVPFSPSEGVLGEPVTFLYFLLSINPNQLQITQWTMWLLTKKNPKKNHIWLFKRRPLGLIHLQFLVYSKKLLPPVHRPSCLCCPTSPDLW